MEGYILILIGLLASQVGTFSNAEQDTVVLFNRQVEEGKVMCLHFWYKMHGDSVGRLQVRILRGERYTHLWSKDGDQGDAWRQSWVTVNNTDNGDAPLLIEAMNSRNGSQISIESITVVSDPCPVPEKHNLFDCKNGESVPLAKLCDFINDCGNGHDELLCGTCNFEENQCGWNDSSSRNYQWQRDRNGTDTAGTGPETDHTLGTSLGYYMAAELSGEVHSNAVLEVELKESAPSCEMHFWYHMWGSGFEGSFHGSLAVSVLGQSNKINMWEKGQDMGNQWNYKVLYLGRQKGPFKVQLVASHNIGSMEGDTAIDDIELKHCGLPEPQPFCSNTEFRCQREACVGLDRRCDFSDDCGDQTDEQGCELYMMCDFQDSWGMWQQETSKDTFSWERKSPTEIFFRPSNTGSNRDHTTNLKTGKYLYIDTTFPRKQGDTAWLLSPALYADEENACKMRLFYHMYGSSVGSLKIYTRRSTNESLTKQWMKSGEVGDYFVRMEVVLPVGNPFQVILEGVVGDGPNGFIVVDDISFTPGCHVFDGTSPNTTAIPTTPPQCPEGEVPCSDQCIFQDKVCDFYSDCADNSDETHCGPCDFEHFACGWIDTSNGLYQWMLEMANISSNPGADHSIGTPYGHFMRVDGGSGGFFSKANLESPVLGPTGLACQMSFWYHLYTFFGVRSTSITLSLLNVTSGTAETLWSAPKKQNSDWINVRLDIGNRPRGFKLLFSASASLSEQDIALDDIQFVGCSVKDHPPGTSHLSCDFEDGLCAWYQDKTDHFEWQRDNGDTAGISNHGPGYDHTTGNGYYMFIATESRQESAYKARLASYPQTPAKKRCVSFWYHIYGSNIGTLNFITKQEGKSEKVRWTRSATQGNKWNFADFHIPETNTFVQFIFEAVPGGTQGSIAIDDVVITESINGSCPAERECTFETSRCNLKDVAGGSFNWTRITREISTNTSSPLEDHTLGTAYGFYLSTQIWKQASRNEGRIATRLYKPTPYSGECLQFWYYMKGENIGTFNIYLQKHRQLKALLWNQTGNQGDLWRHGRVTVQSPDSQYQIIFEGVAGTGHEGDIAIDDLLLLNGPCPPDGFCDFETGLCGWLNVVTEDDIDWTWNSGITPSSTHGPLVDHTTNSALGHYLFIKNNPMIGGRKTAHLLSEYMEPSATACLVFWYHMDMISFAEGTLTVYIKDYEGLRAIWNAKGNHGKIWLEAQVDYNSSSHYQIVIEGKHGHAMDAGSTSLDDIYIEKYLSCSDMALTTAIPTTMEPTQPASPQDCSFEHGLCNWQQETNDTFDWERQTGSAVILPENGPLFDHTVGNIEGFYLIISSQGTANEAVISGPMISDATQLCLSFWYYMFGSSVSTLAVLVHTESHPDSVVWTRRGTQSASWINARVTIRMLDMHKIKLSGKTSSKSHGFIAIDDISVMEGECVSQGTCGFETLSVCNYEQDITADTDWVHTKGLGSGPPADHTYSTDKGYFMAVFGDDLVKRQTAQLLSPEYTPTMESCVRFWYWLAADSTSVFSVHIMQNKELGLDLWALSGNPSQDWDVAQITVSSALNFRIVFKAQLDPAKGSFVALDDVTVAAGACPYTGSCDFEAHQCTWTNSQADDFDWIQANGHFSGPSVDHTTQTPEGKCNPSKPSTATQLMYFVLHMFLVLLLNLKS
ncbi:MAM and LDL-receptor class A domain-containing protein 1-like [Acipenser ruthenus]|uniref:MAM and LDL-receptor class A domain-containing protein 1-like n=1 Tax=Acipenser ruthenus TaxID=7906 RepID=UPI002740FE87|nr:MAM and LDL-receptor class A domain-containing protein 1-like [Acipenser ruthenus]